MQMANMDEVLDPVSFVVVCFRLCKLVLMMWEDKIDTAWMNIELLAQDGGCHGRALYVPSWPALTPRRIPLGFIRLRGFPKSEILFIPFLSFFVGLFCLSFRLFDSFKFAIFEFFLKGPNIEVDRSIWRIGIAICDNSFDKGHNLRHIFCNSGDIVRNANSQLALWWDMYFMSSKKSASHLLANSKYSTPSSLEFLMILSSTSVMFMQYYMAGYVPARCIRSNPPALCGPYHCTSNFWLKNDEPGVAHVAVGVYGGPACVPADISSIEGHKVFLHRLRRTSWLVRLFLSLRPVTKDSCIVEYRKL